MCAILAYKRFFFARAQCPAPGECAGYPSVGNTEKIDDVALQYGTN